MNKTRRENLMLVALFAFFTVAVLALCVAEVTP